MGSQFKSYFTVTSGQEPGVFDHGQSNGGAITTSELSKLSQHFVQRLNDDNDDSFSSCFQLKMDFRTIS